MQQSSETDISSKEIPHITLVITQWGHKTIMGWYHFLAYFTYPFKEKNSQIKVPPI